MPDSPSLTPAAAVRRLAEMSAEVRAAVLLDRRGELAASTGMDDRDAVRVGGLARDLLGAADLAAARAGLDDVTRVEVSRPDGGVFALRQPDLGDRPWTLVAVTVGGALPSLAFFDLRMTVLAIGAGS